MPYIVVEDFRGGLDTRRMNVTSTPGTLTTLTNAHITRGGEIEKRTAFVSLADLPSNTTGLAAAGGQIYCFGSVAASAVTFATGTPANINYVRLQHPSASALTKILSVDFYNGRTYAAAEFADGTIHHFYDGTRITDWFDGRARAQIQVTGGTLGGTAATASFIVTGGTNNPGDNLRVLRVNNVDIIASAVAHTGDNATTAANIVTAIGAGGSGYTASASGATTGATASASRTRSWRRWTSTPTPSSPRRAHQRRLLGQNLVRRAGERRDLAEAALLAHGAGHRDGRRHGGAGVLRPEGDTR